MIDEKLEKNLEDPIHAYFELTYDSYLVIPRVLLQSLPYKWQEKFVELLEEAREMVADIEWHDRYEVHAYLLNDAGELVLIDDPLCDYDKGRRKLPINILDKYRSKAKKAAAGGENA